MRTTTLFNHIRSELIKQDYIEQVRQGDYRIANTDYEFLWFNSGRNYVAKIMQYDQDVKDIVNDLFGGYGLDNPVYDDHFKKTFINHFAKREINRKTIEEFQFKLISTFYIHEAFINKVYHDLDKYLLQTTESKQTNHETNDGRTTTNDRSAYADLPQTSVNLDVDDTVMQYPTDNRVTRNQEKQNQHTDGYTSNIQQTYSLDDLFKTDGVLEYILNEFDKKCFLQIW